MNIYKKIIKNYVEQSLTLEDIYNYAGKNNMMLSKKDATTIYDFIKKNYQSILDGEESSFSQLKNSLDSMLYQKIIELYQYYKSKLM